MSLFSLFKFVLFLSLFFGSTHPVTAGRSNEEIKSLEEDIASRKERRRADVVLLEKIRMGLVSLVPVRNGSLGK